MYRRATVQIATACFWLVVPFLIGTTLVVSANAQGVVERPGDVVPELPDFGSEDPLPPVMPPAIPPALPLVLQAPNEGEGVASVLRIRVHDFEFEGNTVFDREALARVVAPWAGQDLGASDLRRVRDAITRHYVESGYLNSGATLPDQPIRDGVVLFSIIEGRLTDVKVSGHTHYRNDYLRARLLREAGTPLRLSSLEKAIRRLQQEQGMERVDAALQPGLAPGQAVVELSIEESNAIAANLQADNRRPPSIGETGGRIRVSHGNYWGRDDQLSLSVSGSEGLIELAGRYNAPLADTAFRVGGHATWTDGRVVESEFELLDIEVESLTLGVSLDRPLFDDNGHRVTSRLVAEWRRSRTRAFGLRFDFPGSGTDEGEATVAVVRGSLDWTYRDRMQAFALRSTLSWGLDILGATSAPTAGLAPELGELPNGRFLTWLGQMQWARRLPLAPTFRPIAQLRLDTQLSSDPLLPFERLSVGGHSSVRGFRENQLVADEGLIGTVELRVPMPWPATSKSWLYVTPFYDIGVAWNRDRPSPGRSTLQSVGLSVDARPLEWLRGELTLGWPIDGKPSGDTLQERGVSFRVEMQF